MTQGGAAFAYTGNYYMESEYNNTFETADTYTIKKDISRIIGVVSEWDDKDRFLLKNKSSGIAEIELRFDSKRTGGDLKIDFYIYKNGTSVNDLVFDVKRSDGSERTRINVEPGDKLYVEVDHDGTGVMLEPYQVKYRLR